MTHSTEPAPARGGRSVPDTSGTGARIPAAPHKWRDLIMPLKACARRLELNGTDIHFLEVLISFTAGEHLTLDPSGRLIVFAGNAAIARRMGISGDSTVNRCIRRAEARGLVQRVLSPNRKRYRRVGSDGSVLRSYGIDIGPLVAGHQRLHQIAAELAAEDTRAEALRLDCVDTLSRLRRLEARLGHLATDRLDELQTTIADATRCLRRRPVFCHLAALLDTLRSAVRLWSNRADDALVPDPMSSSDARNEQHKDQTLQTVSVETAGADDDLSEGDIARALPTLTAILAEKSTRRDLADALDNTVKLLPNATASWERALETLGMTRAALLLGYILERGDSIANPGGYLHRLVTRYRTGRLSLPQLIRTCLPRLPPASPPAAQAHWTSGAPCS